MEIIKRADIVAGVPERWQRTYRTAVDHPGRYGNKQATMAKLLALEPGFSAETVNAIIGNTSWTELRCDECIEDSPCLISVGDQNDRPVSICIDCLKKAVVMVEAG